MNNLPEIMSVNDAARFLRCSVDDIMGFYKSGELSGVDFGGTFCFKSSDIIRLKSRSGGVFKSPSVHCPLKQVLKEDKVLFLESATKRDILLRMVDLLAESPEVPDRDELEKGIFNREKLMSTGMGLGIAIPHIRLPSVKGVCMAAALVKNGVPDYETLDDIPVKLVFMIVARPDQHAEHLKIVSQLSLKLKEEEKREAVFAVSTPKEFILKITE